MKKALTLGLTLTFISSLFIGSYLHLQSGLSQSIAEAKSYLERHQTSQGSFLLQNDSRFIVWETANVAYALGLESPPSPMLTKAIEYLQKVQKDDDGYSYRKCKSCKNCIETSSVAFVALENQGAYPKKENHYLTSRLPSDGKWLLEYLVETEPYFPSATGYGIAAVLLTRPSSEKIQESVHQSIQYLRETQKENGSWGVSDGYYGSYFYTLYGVLWGLHSAHQEDADFYRKAIVFIKNSQDSDGHFHGEDELSQSQTQVSKELHTALALNALLLAPQLNDWWSIVKGSYWLLDQQRNDGRWNGGFYPHKEDKSEDLYATARSLVILYKLKSILSL